MRFKTALLCLPLVGFALASGGWAEELQPLRYVALFTVKPGQEKTFSDLVEKHDKPVFERLMAEGTILGWGVVTPVLHGQTPATHGVWWTCSSYEGLGKILAAFEEIEKTMGEEAVQQFVAAVDLEKHSDSLIRSMVFRTKAAGPGTHPYISVAQWQVKPGKGSQWLERWKKYLQPVYEKLLADGVILAFGVDREEEHTMDPTFRQTWVVLPDLAAVDKVDAAFDAAHSEEEWEGINSGFRELGEPGAHRDSMYYSLEYTTK